MKIANGYMKRCPASLIIREMKIKITPVRWPSSKRTRITNIGEDVGKGESLFTVCGHVN